MIINPESPETPPLEPLPGPRREPDEPVDGEQPFPDTFDEDDEEEDDDLAVDGDPGCAEVGDVTGETGSEGGGPGVVRATPNRPVIDRHR
jgi:hypothetical protein